MNAQDRIKQWSESPLGRGISRWAPVAMLLVLVWGVQRLKPAVQPYAIGAGQTAVAWLARAWQGARERIDALASRLAGKLRANSRKDA